MTLFVGAASAQAYVGGTVGFSNFSVDCPRFSNCDTQDTALKIFGGYTVAPHFAIEAAYIDFGGTKGSVGSVNTYTVETTAFVVNGAYRFDFSPKWTGVARLGLANVSSDLKDAFGTTSDSAIKLFAGVGVEYGVTKNVKVIGALDLTNFEVGGSSGSLNAVSAGVQFAF